MGILSDWQIESAKIITPFEPCRARPGVISFGVSSYGYDVRVGYRFRIFSPVGCQVIDPKAFDERMLVDVDLTTPINEWVRLKSWCLPYGTENQGRVVQIEGDFVQILTESQKIIRVPRNQVELINGTAPDHVIIPSNSFALAESIETFDIPRDCLAVCIGKSTYARCGIIINCTPLEPAWKGKVTIEISNTTPLPAKIYAGEGIMQVLFFRSDGIAQMQLSALREEASYVDLRLNDKMKQAFTDGECRISYADRKGKYQDQPGLTLPKVQGEVK